MKRSQVPQSKKAFVDTGGVDINALIDGSGIVLDFTKPMLHMKALNPVNMMSINQLLVHNLIVLARLQ